MRIPERCGLCGRKFYSSEGRYPVGEPEGHHQPPREFRRRKWYISRKYYICNRCHIYIHRVFTNKELSKIDFGNMGEHPRLQSYLKWITKFDISHFLKTHELDKVSVYVKKKKEPIIGSEITDIGYFYMQTYDDFIYHNKVYAVEYDGEMIWRR